MPIPFYAVIWGILVYTWVCNYLIRMALSSLLPPIIEEFGLSYASAGFLSTGFFYAYLAMQLPAGILGDRFGRKRLLLTGVLLGAAASALTGLATSLTTLFLARLLTGLSQGFLFSNDRVIIAATTPREKMALGQGVSFSGAGLGTTLGLLLAGALGVLMPWRYVFFLFALPPLLAALLLWRVVPEPAHATAAADPDWPFRRVLRSGDFWLLGVTGIMPVYVQFLLATWGPLLFSEVGITDLGRSASLASLQGLMAPVGLLVSGLVADRVHRRGMHRKVVIVAAVVMTTLSMIAMGAAIQARGPAWLLTLLMLLASFSMWCTWSPSYALVGGLFPASVMGKAFGLYNSTCFIGAILSPFLTGWIKDMTGSFAAGLYGVAALSVVSVVTALGIRPAFRLTANPPAVAAPRHP
ncbi:MAG: MFS transporter [Candidatus Rokubacteria bacterium]|nr:MFS transporter [Candidatus Rokubacteria bacterium]